MNGIVVVDKPADMTSAHLVARVKKGLKADKVGHTGTLDPFATGVMVCCLNQATRLVQFLMYGKKRYEAVMCLGIRTDTQDFTGRVTSKQPDLAVADQQIHSVFRGFMNIKEQNPPVFSALKHRGVPLYKMARKGKFVQKPSRRISIYELEVLDINLPHVGFEVSCSQGTYVRTLCDDIGQSLGCGAHLVQLCRTENNGFTLDEAVSLNTLETLAATGKASSIITPMSAALRGMPQVTAGRSLAQKIQYGQPITREEVEPFDGSNSSWIKVVDTDGSLIAVLSTSRKNGVYPYAGVFANREP
jgi:tRNA pseudouridine55 synthase